jgi:hypothetical protein
MEPIERIYCAAIWYKDLPTAKFNPININRGIVVEGHRHADIIRTVLNLLNKRTVQFGEDSVGETIQGFVTNTHRFVDRIEAKIIATNSNQIIEETNFNELYSEDIY